MGINWIPITGKWEISPNSIVYKSPTDQVFPHGIVLSNQTFKDGATGVDVRFPSWDGESAARVILGFDAKSKEYISIGLGGYGYAFVLSRYIPRVGWQGEALEGSSTNLASNNTYHLHISIVGQAITLDVDGITVIDHQLSQPLSGDRVGLFTYGSNEVSFMGFSSNFSRPTGFVIMDFSGRYDALYSDVLSRVAEKEDITLRRADDIKGPGIILQDIVKDIAESTVVVAEITSPNPNVFYELGYAHALKKPTILLAKSGEPLPFDVAGYRCIFYDDSIGGKSEVEREFRRHIRTILGKSVLEERGNNQ